MFSRHFPLGPTAHSHYQGNKNKRSQRPAAIFQAESLKQGRKQSKVIMPSPTGGHAHSQNVDLIRAKAVYVRLKVCHTQPASERATFSTIVTNTNRKLKMVEGLAFRHAYRSDNIINLSETWVQGKVEVQVRKVFDR